MPQPAIQHAMQMAVQHHQAGRLAEAEALCQEILRQDASNANALHLLGQIAAQQGRLDQAIACFEKAVALRPDYTKAYNNLGAVLGIMGRFDEAVAACRKAIALDARYADAHYNLGLALQSSGRLEEAIAAYRQALLLRADSPKTYSNLGLALRDSGRLEESIAAARKAIELKADYADAHGNLGAALREKGDLEGAAAAYERAIQLQPDHADAHLYKGMLLLAMGRFEEGWREYEWRRRQRGHSSERPEFSASQWKGEDPSGRTILLYAEQGIGDTIQFVRYAPLAARRGARVIVECQPELVSLLAGVKGVQQVVPKGEPLPPFDLCAPMLSLPLAFGTTLQTILAEVPYLSPDPGLAGLWRSRLASRSTLHAPRLKVGLVWAGKPGHKNDRNRSLPLSILAPLAAVKGVRFYSLQVGAAAGQAKSPPAGMDLCDLTGELRDFADTAALMANLDLVISVDTAVAHLAGTMAMPVWLLLPFYADWRWMLAREDTPWYPTMRLFRQTARGDWEGVIGRVAEEVRRLA